MKSNGTENNVKVVNRLILIKLFSVFLPFFQFRIAYSSVQKVREPRLIKALLYVLLRGLGMRLRRRVNVADQITAS